MKGLITILCIIFGALSLNAQQGDTLLYVSGDGSLPLVVEANASLSVSGNYINNTVLFNDGEISTTGNWINNGTYSGEGTIILNGPDSQFVFHNLPTLGGLSLEGSGIKMIDSTLKLTKELNLEGGILFLPAGDTIIVEETAQVFGGANDSYIEGNFYMEGTGFRYFPIGKDGIFSPITLEDVKGVSPRLSFQVYHRADSSKRGGIGIKEGIINGKPDDGWVSESRHWVMDVSSGEFEGSPVGMRIIDENIPDFNRIVVAEGEKPIVNSGSKSVRTYRSIGKISAEGTAQSGYITSEREANAKSRYFTLAQASSRTSDGEYFLPTGFSPNAPNELERIVKLFGYNLAENNFKLEIYNNWNQLVFSTSDLLTAMNKGWDGYNENTGRFETTGTYHYVIMGSFVNGNKFQDTGTITLIN